MAFGMADSLSINGEVHIPLVVLKQSKGGVVKYYGFVPGLSKMDTISTNLEECKQKLKEQTLYTIKEMAINNTPFPFFPTKDEILSDFQNVCFIAFMKIKSIKRVAQ